MGRKRPNRNLAGQTDDHGACYVNAMSRLLITFGIILLVAGLLWPWLRKAGLGRLPGDIVIERGNFVFYLPITTSLVVSILLSLLLWWLNR